MASFNFYQPIANDAWVIPHNLNSIFLAIDAMELSGNSVYTKIEPSAIKIIDSNTAMVQFSSPVIGRARIVSATNK